MQISLKNIQHRFRIGCLPTFPEYPTHVFFLRKYCMKLSYVRRYSGLVHNFFLTRVLSAFPKKGFWGLATFPFILLKRFVWPDINSLKGPNKLVKHAHTNKTLRPVMEAYGDKSLSYFLPNTSLVVSLWTWRSSPDVSNIKHIYSLGSLQYISEFIRQIPTAHPTLLSPECT
jgi:hypothetical protein